MPSTNFNLALMSIPAYMVLASVPHAYGAYLATGGDRNKHDNCNPHSANAQDKIKRSLSAKRYAAYERAKRCHVNALENMPLFVAAIFAGLMAERSAGTGSVGLDNFVVGWMACRIVYTVNYIVTESKGWSYLRSAMYIASTGWAFTVLGKAAYAVGP